MTTISLVEIISAAFIFIILLRLAWEQESASSNRYLKLSLWLCIFSLVIDALAYSFVGPEYPVAVRYAINLLAFEAGAVNAFGFTLYTKAVITEKEKPNPWVFRSLITVVIVWFTAVAVEFVSGRFITYTDGIEEVSYSIPVYLQLLSIAVIVCLSAVVIENRKILGNDVAFMFCAFNLTPIIGILVANFTEYDFTYVFEAIALAFIAEFIQKKQIKEHTKQQQTLSDGLAREYHTVWLMDGFGEHNLHLYRSTGRSTVRSAVQLGLDRPCYDTSVVQYIRDNVVEEDQERVIEETRFETVVRETPEVGTYVVSYRRYTDDRNDYTYHQMCFTRAAGTDGTINYILAYRDADQMLREQLAQQKQLAEALSMADAANKAKTDFLFNMSHDIRTPMNAIIGFTNMAKKEIANPEKALDSLEKVLLSSDILLNLINDVLDMSRIESGKVELHEEKYEITEAFDSFEAAMASLAASKKVDLRFTIGEIRDKYIFADGPRFDRVMINIISNAIKYTPAGGFVRVSADQIADTQQGYGNYRFTVTDSGIGMSGEFQKHMFENFSREENPTTRRIQGTGLGLSLAKKLVDMMKGTVSCISTQGIGTTFTVIFPFRLQTEEDKKEPADEIREYRELELKGKRALLVEDNELNREIAEELLSEEGIVVDSAADGQKAVNKVRENGADYYDFILMDIQMPVMDGYTAAKTIRSLIPEFNAPIIALSANAFAEDKKRSLDAGMNDHVAKPVNPGELKAVLAKQLYTVGKG